MALRLFLLLLPTVLAACTGEGERSRELYLQALKQKQSGRLNEAAKLYRRVLELREGDVAALVDLRSIHRVQKKTAAAEVLSRKIEQRQWHFKKAAAVGPFTPEQLESLIAEFEESIAEQSRSVKLYQQGLELYLMKEDAAKIISVARRLLELEPKNLGALTTLSVWLSRAGRYEEAYPYLKRLYQKGYAGSWLLNLLGCSLLYQKRYSESVSRFEKVLQSRQKPPSHELHALLFMGYALVKLGKSDQARHTLETAAKRVVDESGLSAFKKAEVVLEGYLTNEPEQSTARRYVERVSNVAETIAQEYKNREEPTESSRIDPSIHDPKICIGVHPRVKGFGLIASIHGKMDRHCAKGQAFYSTSGGGRIYDDGTGIVITAPCCQIPAGDILLDEHLYSIRSCPDFYVATGSTIIGRAIDEAGRVILLRCSKVNDKRYVLGPPTAGIKLGKGSHIGSVGTPLTARERIPPAIRYSVARKGKRKWDVTFCLGYPWGSLFTAKYGKHCDDQQFRQLRYRGAPGDPPEGTPVVMFPDCLRISDPLDPKATCVK